MFGFFDMSPGLPVIDSGTHRSHRVKFGFTILAIATITLLGYLAFVVFLKDIAPSFSLYSLYFVATVAGIATFFSPCSFPLLPGYLSFYYNARESQNKEKAFYYGSLAAAGVVSSNMVLGVLIASLGQGFASAFSVSSPNPSNFTRILRIGIGGFLVILGAVQLSNRTFHNRMVDSLAKGFSRNATRGGKRLYLYGFGYTAAGIGCAGPITAGLIVLALGSGGFTTAFLAFIVFSLTMASLMVGISLLIAKSKAALINSLKASTPKIKRVTSLVLIAVGTFLIYVSLNLGFFVSVFFPK